MHSPSSRDTRYHTHPSSLLSCSHLFHTTPLLLYSQGTLRDCLAKYKADLEDHNVHKQAQEEKIASQLKQLHDLWTALGTSFKPGFDEVGYDITDSKLTAISKEVSIAAGEVAQRRIAVADLCKEIAEQIDELKLEEESTDEDKDAAMGARITAAGLVGQDIAISLTRTTFTDLDRQIVSKQYDAVGVHASTIKALEARTDILARMRTERDSKLREMAQKITHLWVRLAVPTDEQQAWIKNHKGLSIKSLRSCQLELIRLLHLKAQSLSTLISHARAKLTELWDELQMSDAERAEFVHFKTTEVSDATLDAHEQMIKHVELRANAMRPLLQLVEKRAALKEEEAELKRSEQDPNRYKIPHRLIQETRTRKRLEKLIPKVDADLRQGIPAWEEQYGDFKVGGIRYLDLMDEENAIEQLRRDEEKNMKDREKSMKKAAATTVNASAAVKTANNIRAVFAERPATNARPASAQNAMSVTGPSGGVVKKASAGTSTMSRPGTGRKENAEEVM